MSKVISFRLNPDNPREARALEILKAKQSEGFSSRRVLTDALIGIAAPNYPDTLFPIDELYEAVEQFSGLMECLINDNRKFNNSTRQDVIELSDNFLESMKNTIKPGLNFN